MLYFSDLDSGPNSGGQGNGGAFVTLYGTRFGNTPGTVTIGGGQAVGYPIWSDNKITVQLGSAAGTGSIVVTTAAGAVSNAIPFTVRAGNIYFVSTTGNDAKTGSFAAPWRTVLKARDTIRAGDIVYAMNGVAQTTDDGQGWSAAMLLRNGGTAGMPMALVAYPGASVTIGNIAGPAYGVRVIDNGTMPGYWVLAGLILRGQSAAAVLAGPSNVWRIVGNDISCPNGDGEVGCFGTSEASHISFYGNNVHDTGTATASAHYHAVYWSTDSNHIDMGWNTVANVHGCRGVQTYSSPLGAGGPGDPTGHNMYDLSIHDNVIHDTQCDGIILATVDPSQGKVQVYNNIIYNAGKGPNNPEMSGAWTCVNVPGTTANGTPGGGTVDVYSNTMFNCGSFSTPPYGNANAGVENGGNNTNLKIRLRNNIIYQTSAAPYLVIYGPADGIQGSNNLFFGNGPVPSDPNLTVSLNVDPMFVNTALYDSHLNAGSPAATAGVNTGQSHDYDGIPLPSGGAYPIGALALPGAPSSITVTSSPASDNLQEGQKQQFTATVTGTSDTAVNWSMSPQVGSLSATGDYTAPSVIPAAQHVIVIATSAADPTKSTQSTVSLTPPNVTISVSPSTASLSGGQSQQFTAVIGGTAHTGVTWSMSPQAGSLSASGYYTAPSSVTVTQTLVITATSASYPTVTATATVHLTPTPTIAVTVSPSSVSLTVGQSQPFAASVTGTTVQGVTWSMSPSVGSLSASGLYTAPASISVAQTVSVTATSVADQTKSATAAVKLNPPANLTVAPSIATLGPNQSQPFTAALGGVPVSASWTMSPALGTLSATGLYTAPATITSLQSVIIAASVGDASQSATVTLTPSASGFTLSWTAISSTQIRVNWTAPAGRPSKDWVALSGQGAPDWWYVSSQYTHGATSGSFTMNLPATSGYYEVRYYQSGSYVIYARSSPVPSGVAPFTVTASSGSVSPGGQLSVAWNVPAGRPSTDMVALYPVGSTNDAVIWRLYPNGVAAGSATLTAPTTPGVYEFRWRIGYLTAAYSEPVVVQ
jgi:hypothetical protein